MFDQSDIGRDSYWDTSRRSISQNARSERSNKSRSPLKTQDRANVTDNNVSRKSVHWKDLYSEFRPDYSIYNSQSVSKDRKSFNDTFARSNEDIDETAEFVGMDEGVSIPAEGQKATNIRSSKFTASKYKTAAETGFRKTETNRLNYNNRLSSGERPGKRNTTTSAFKTKTRYTTSEYDGGLGHRSTSSNTQTVTRTKTKQTTPKTLAQKFKKYAQLEYEESKQRNRLASYKNFNIDFAFKLLK